jgi:hypothetical protein
VDLYTFCALVCVKGGLFDKDYIFAKNVPVFRPIQPYSGNPL